MSPTSVHPTAVEARRKARRAWTLLHQDAKSSIALAEAALAAAGGDDVARAAALLARGFHRLYFATPAEAAADLEAAHGLFVARGDRAGQILAGAGLARSMWRSGRFREALERVLPLRDEGLKVLRGDQRGVLLNTIAGGYSAQGRSDRAFAYMYEALRDARPARGHGFDTVLHCNISHELLQLGDCHEALRHVDSGLQRCQRIQNMRLLSVLLINRVLSLTDLDRPAEALPDVQRVLAMPADADGRGPMATHFETLAIAALRAGEVALGASLVAQAHAALHAPIPDEHVEMAVADALLSLARGNAEAALTGLQAARPFVEPPAEALSLRAQGLYLQTLSDVHEARGDAAAALQAMRRWQQVQRQRAEMASQARYQAAALQTELLRLQHRIEEQDARRREVEAMNEQLSRRVAEVQALQAALRQQATRDELTGLFNRRHLNETLPAMLALARRDGQPLAVAIIDLDHFKAVNDGHGHGAGDLLLAAFGRLLGENSRRSDVACRYGGEEFCLLMPRTDAAAARRKVAALLRRWRGERFAVDGAVLEGLSFSAGVADSQRCPGSVAQLLKAADDELLAAKRQGRARVRAAEAVPA
ncbi:diguanylate cyclase [Rubrivivax sp. RP6-9]|uniref:diguanylate cyclase n=1 Tax=Rubrivivax sp. RP6-9 TaxID=3415750 RepID=UPI003CC504F3